jgi:hypothetical protein
MAHPKEWKERAKELWETPNSKPSRVIDAIEKEFGHRLKYTTLKDWADKGGWKHFVDHDTPKHLNPNFPAGVSGIADPIYHLSLVLGKRSVREDSATRSTSKEKGSLTPAIVARALEAVDREYDPGPHTIDYLKPVLTKYVNTIKRATKAGRENRFNEDPQRNLQSQNRLAQRLVQGLPIDEGHASLGMVYTNPEEPEASNDSDGTLREIVHGTGGEVVRIVKAPGMPQGELPPPPPAKSGKDYIDPGDAINECFSETFAEARERLAREQMAENAQTSEDEEESEK